MADEVNLVRSRVDIVELVSESVSLKRAGKNWKGLCPFHDDKRPSFDVSPSTGRYKCWACGEGGDIFTWVMKTQNVEFGEALRMLAKRAGVSLAEVSPEQRSVRERANQAMAAAQAFFVGELGKSGPATEYCQRRGLDQEIIETWGLGYAPDVDDAIVVHLQRSGLPLSECKDLFLVDGDPNLGYFSKFRARLMFPIRDERGELVAFGGRLLGDGIPKYINSSDTPLYSKRRVLYGMNRAKEAMRQKNRAVLTEGYLDVIACHRAGINEAVASLGTSLSEEHAKLLKRWCDEVVILYDSDAAGQKAADRGAEILRAADLKVRIALMPNGEDPDTLLRTAGPEAVRRSVETGISPMDYKIQQLRTRVQPSEEEFWKEAVEILAGAPTHMEMMRQLEELAPQYPGIRDRAKAVAILERQALSIRKSNGRRHPDDPFRAVVQIVRPTMDSAEKAIFLALLDESLRKKAYSALSEPDIFGTQAGELLAKSILAVFPNSSPTGELSSWMALLEPADSQDLLSDIAGEELHHVNETVLDDALKNLRTRKLERQLQSAKSDVNRDDEALLHVSERLKVLKPDPRPPTS